MERERERERERQTDRQTDRDWTVGVKLIFFDFESEQGPKL